MQEIKYDPNKKLWEYEPNIIVKGVPVKYFDSDLDAATYLARMKGGKKWKISVQKLIDHFDTRKLGELFYCLRCKRLEDGARRLVIAREKGIKTINVRTGGNCYKRYVSFGRLIRSDSTFAAIFQRAMKNNPTSHKLDRRWHEANVREKWPLFSKLVDFRNRSFLDIGCHIGYSCIRAWNRMASNVVGIDIRSDVLAVAKFVASKLNVKGNKIVFRLEDWKKMSTKGLKYDIVMCSGLLHYFSMNEYERLFKKLLNICKETLIIEMRLRVNREDESLTRAGTQTLPTDGWLIKRLKEKGFEVKARFVRKPGSRELWVARRK